MKNLVLITGLIGLIVSVWAQAATLSGYAWSETIGWIKFTGPGYGVVIDETSGELKGYAWSENIGWIKFNPIGPYPGLPPHSARLNFDNGKIEGWARACAGTESDNCSGGVNPNSDIWDGWIKLSGFENSVTQAGNATDGCYLTGYAWGSDVVGWIKFSQVISAPCLVGEIIQPPVIKQLECTFSISPRRLIAPQRTARIVWSCKDADRCSISPAIGSVSNIGGSIAVTPPTGTTTYTLKCANDAPQTTSLSATVTVIKSRLCETIPYFPGCPQ